MLHLPAPDLTAPVRAAMLARDPAALVATFAPDVVLRSPVTARPFRGREEVGELMTELIGALEDLEYTAVADGGDVQVLAFRMRLGGRDVELVDLLRYDDVGRVAEIVVHGRPLQGSALFAAIVGPRLARRRSRWRGAAAVAARPLPRVLAALDAAGAKLVR
jgi:hypothetical protein